MVSNNFFQSSLPQIYGAVQNAMTLYPKELVVATLRDFFSNCEFYKYTHDHWGFPLTPDQTNLPQNAGFPPDSSTTRLLITEAYRFDVQYFPSIHVRHGGARSVPISINREAYTTIYDEMVFEDGYGNIKTFPNPVAHIFMGAWEGSINIDIKTKDLRARDDLVDLVSLLFVDIAFNDLYKSGLIVKGVSAGAPTEQQDRNDYIFGQTVTLDVRSEWRRHIPIDSVLEILNFSIEFQRLEPNPGPVAQNLTINMYQTLHEILVNL